MTCKHSYTFSKTCQDCGEELPIPKTQEERIKSLEEQVEELHVQRDAEGWAAMERKMAEMEKSLLAAWREINWLRRRV